MLPDRLSNPGPLTYETGALPIALRGPLIQEGQLSVLAKVCSRRTGPEVIKLFSYSTQLSMEFFQLINVKMPTIVGILTFMSRKNSIVDLSEPEKC